MLNKLYNQIDFLNLTLDDIKKIVNILDIDIPEGSDKYEFLFENMDSIKSNEEANTVLNNKILAGQATVKWYKYEYDENLTKESLKKKLESKELNFNISTNEMVIDSNIKNKIVSIIYENNVYTIKLFISDGYKRYNNGIKSKKEEVMKSIIVKININDCWVEIRANDERCNKVVNILKNSLGLKKLSVIKILDNYENDINVFKDDLINGFYLNYKAAPSEIITLTEEDGEKIATMIAIIDDYFETKDGNKLLSSLEEMNYDTDGVSFSSLLLAGIDSLGMKIRNDSDKDMSNQSLYNILREHFVEDSSYIKFSNKNDGDKYTMKIGLKTNSIVFKSSVTEEVIEYIRGKIL